MKKKKNAFYSVHPGVKMIQNWVASLPEKTGKTLDQWAEIVKKECTSLDEKERRAWLKEKHGFGTNHAWWIAEYVEGRSAWEGDPESYLAAADGYVEAMFSGSKAHLFPIYEALLEKILTIGDEVRFCPCKTIVPCYRNHVFAEIKPTTRTRIDLGFALKDLKPTGRLIDTGGFAKKNRITHRIPITKIEDIDDEVIKWLKYAYNLDA